MKARIAFLLLAIGTAVLFCLWPTGRSSTVAPAEPSDSADAAQVSGEVSPQATGSPESPPSRPASAEKGHPDDESPTQDPSPDGEGPKIEEAARQYLEIFLPRSARLSEEQVSRLAAELSEHQSLHKAVLEAKAAVRAKPGVELGDKLMDALDAEEAQFDKAAFWVLNARQIGYMLDRQPGFITDSYPLYGGPQVLHVDLSVMSERSRRQLLRRLRVRNDAAGLSATHLELMARVAKSLPKDGK